MVAVILHFHKRMSACVRNDDDQCSEWFEVTQRLCQGCVLSPLFFNTFFAAVLLVALQRVSEDADIHADLVHLQGRRARIGFEITLEFGRCVVWGVLHADDACAVSRSPRGLEIMRTIPVNVSSAFGLIVTEKKLDTKTMCVPIPHTPATPIAIKTSGLQYRQTTSFIYLGGAVTERLNLSLEVDRWGRAGWMSFNRY